MTPPETEELVEYNEPLPVGPTTGDEELALYVIPPETNEPVAVMGAE